MQNTTLIKIKTFYINFHNIIIIKNTHMLTRLSEYDLYKDYNMLFKLTECNHYTDDNMLYKI